MINTKIHYIMEAMEAKSQIQPVVLLVVSCLKLIFSSYIIF